MTVTIEGNRYDLSGEFLEIVAQMAKDGFCVKNSMLILVQAYDENGTVYGPDEYLSALALYVDGSLIDLEEYRDEYETWLKDVEKLGASAAYTLHLSYARYYINSMANDESQLGDDTMGWF